MKPSYKTGYARNASESKHPTLWKGLVGAWVPALGVTGNTLHDISAFKNHGTLTNMDAGTDWVVGQEGYALDFDGIDDNIVVSSKDLSEEFTVVVLWNSKVNSETRMVIGGAGVSSTKLGLLNSKFFVRAISGGATDNSILAPTINNEHQITLTRNTADKVDLYVDSGVAERLFSDVAQVGNFTIRTLGAHANDGQFFKGKVGSIIIYNRALKSNEIILLHRKPLAVFELKKDRR